eukprot:6490662-Amphidinium_carterae.3
MPKFLTSVPKTLISAIRQDSYIRNCGSSESSKPHWQDSHLSHRHSDSPLSLNTSHAGTTLPTPAQRLHGVDSQPNDPCNAGRNDVLDSELIIIENIPETPLQRCREEETRPPFLLRQSDLQSVGCVVPYVRKKIMKGPDAHLHMI